MSCPTGGNAALDLILSRSDELHTSIWRQIDAVSFDSSPRSETVYDMCGIALEHATSLRILIASGCPTSAVTLMRPQFEALTRSIWILYAASEGEITRLRAPLDVLGEQRAKNMPLASEMLRQLSTSAPAGAYQMLTQCKDATWGAMNSFVHGGIHPLRRHSDGYPLPLIVQVVQTSNALSTMVGMVLANLTGDEGVTKPMSQLQLSFADCLPPLVR